MLESFKERDFVAGVDKAMQVLIAFGADLGHGRRAGRLTLADVANATGLSRAAARRYVLTLTQLGYLECVGKVYQPSSKSLDLGQAYFDSFKHWSDFHALCNQTAHALGDCAWISVLHRDQVAIVAVDNTHNPAPLWLRVGHQHPATASAAGRVLLATQAAEPAHFGLAPAATKRQYTSKTLVSHADLQEQISRARSQEFAIEMGELDQNFCSVAVLLRRPSYPLASLSVTTATTQSSEQLLQERILPVLQKIQALNATKH